MQHPSKTELRPHGFADEFHRKCGEEKELISQKKKRLSQGGKN